MTKSRKLVATLLFLTILGCSVHKSQYSHVDSYLEFAIACGRTTPEFDKTYVRSLNKTQLGTPKVICIDRRSTFKKLRVTKIELSYLNEFDSYIISIYFEPNQLYDLNSFIQESIDDHYYIISNDVAVEPENYFMFTSELSSPKLSISVDSKERGIRLRNDLSNNKSTLAQDRYSRH